MPVMAQTARPLSVTADGNQGFVECWNDVLTPKWIRFRHLLSGNGKIHSDIAYRHFGIGAGDKVLDIGCGFGETCLEIGRMVGPSGEVLGLDCTDAFLEIANKERDEAGLPHVRYELGDAQVHPVREGYYDVVYSRFGVMFFQSAVRALRNSHRALKPGGRVCLIVWRSPAENPCWGAAKAIALRYLPPAGDGAMTCGPGPFFDGGRRHGPAHAGRGGIPPSGSVRVHRGRCVRRHDHRGGHRLPDPGRPLGGDRAGGRGGRAETAAAHPGRSARFDATLFAGRRRVHAFEHLGHHGHQACQLTPLNPLAGLPLRHRATTDCGYSKIAEELARHVLGGRG